ncbi:MAG TPA: amidophosphoribosyltransferase, partial [Rhodocyclaceae bacterium]|nr:amidophosphoribosyltransferase [Rhodocyclaceae bacterium]
LESLKAAVRAFNPAISQFDCSCFDGIYVTGDVTAEYLEGVETARGKSAKASLQDELDGGQLDLNLVSTE